MQPWTSFSDAVRLASESTYGANLGSSSPEAIDYGFALEHEDYDESKKVLVFGGKEPLYGSKTFEKGMKNIVRLNVTEQYFNLNEDDITPFNSWKPIKNWIAQNKDKVTQANTLIFNSMSAGSALFELYDMKMYSSKTFFGLSEKELENKIIILVVPAPARFDKLPPEEMTKFITFLKEHCLLIMTELDNRKNELHKRVCDKVKSRTDIERQSTTDLTLNLPSNGILLFEGTLRTDILDADQAIHRVLQTTVAKHFLS